MPAANAWTRERHRLTAEHLKRAAGMIAGGRVPGRGVEWADTGCTGLSLRVGRRAAAWYLRMDTKTIRLGDMEALPVPAAREAAQRARLDLRAGRDPATNLAAFGHALAATGDVDMAVDAGFPAEAPMPSDDERRRNGPWQWGDLVDAFLAVKLPKLRASWARQYEGHLRHPAFDAIRHRQVSTLTLGDLNRVRDEAAAANTVSISARVVAAGKESLTWAWRNHGPRAGLGRVDYPWWTERWNVEYAAATRDHVPTVAELARTLAVAERHRTLGSTDQETSPGTLKALWAVVLTAQRTGALGGTRRDRVIPMPGRDGWEVWTWSGAEMKGGKDAGRPHALPVPPAAIEALARFDEGVPGEWLFPSRASGRHVTSDGLNQLMYRLQGKPKAGKKGAVTERGEDLFKRHRIRVWTPHDARRALSTFLADEELGGAASAILAHSTGKGDHEGARLEDVTRRVYAKAQRLDLKARGMELWTDAVLDAYWREAAALEIGARPGIR